MKHSDIATAARAAQTTHRLSGPDNRLFAGLIGCAGILTAVIVALLFSGILTP